jgi:hypothetical protein
MTMLDHLTPEEMVDKIGKIGWYAPGMYTCTCSLCDARFVGDKRAQHCLPCAVKTIQAFTEEVGEDSNAKGGIVAAACRSGDITISMPAPARHHDVLQAMHTAGFTSEQVAIATQGFLDHRGLFLSRRTAKIVASQWGQITRQRLEDGQPDLFSEDLW